MDISNLFGNTHEGIHAASLGGTWQAVVFGFSGVRIRDGKLFINPRIPGTWHEIAFTLVFQGDYIHLRLSNDIVNIKVATHRKSPMETAVFNKRVYLKP